MVTDERRAGAGPLKIQCCPRCRYIRQPADTAPDWQCPSCGVALQKASEFGDLEHHPYMAPRGAYHPWKDGRSSSRPWVIVALLAIACAAGMHWLGARQAGKGRPASAEAPASAASSASPYRPEG